MTTSNNNGRRFGISALLAAIALLAVQSAVAASTLTFTGFEYGSKNVNLATNPPVPAAIVSSDSVGAYNTNVNGGPTFESYCVDIWQYLSFNHNYSLGSGKDYTYLPSMVGYVTQAGTLSSAAVDNLSRLYTEAHSSTVGSATNSAAFQLAVWEIAFEKPGNYNLATGNFYSTGPSSVTSVATGWLNNLPNYSPHNYYVGGYVSPKFQDVIVFGPVPEPGTYALMLAGLGLMGFIVQRRRKERID